MNLVAKMALSQLINFMKKENISELRVFITSENEIDFIPAKNPDSFILKSEHETKINELKNYLKSIK